MFIKDIHINGFGIFHNFHLPNLSSGLTIIEGLNETGKTTILAFIRAVLFGFEDARSKRNPYPPLSGGEYGGTLTITTQSDEEFIIDRSAGPRGGTVKVIRPDGTLGDQEELGLLLARTSKDIFRTAFAFGLSELQDIDTLTEGEVQARIYSAGIGLAGKSLPDVQKKLDQTIGKLFKVKGRAQVINKLLAERESFQQRLRMLTEHSDTYALLRKKHSELTNTIQREEDAKRTDATRLQRVESLLRAWEDWVELRSVGEELAALPAIDSFPANGVERLESLTSKRESIQEALSELQAKIRVLEGEQKGLEINQSILAQRSSIEGMVRGRDKFDEAENDLPKVQEELTSAEAGFQASLRQLGPNWDEDKLGAFDSSIPTREEVRRHSESLAHSQMKLRDAQQDRQHLTEQEALPLWPGVGLALMGVGAGLVLSWLGKTTAGLWLGAFFAVIASSYFLYRRHQKVSLRERLQTARSLEEGNHEEFEARKQEWSTYLIEKGTDPDLSPESALEVFTTIEGTRTQLRSVEGLRSRVDGIHEYIEAYKDDAKAILKETGRPLGPDQPLTLAIDNLVRDLGNSTNNQTRHEYLERDISKANSERQAKEAVLTRVKEDIAALISEGGVETEEEFRERGVIFTQRQALEAICRERTRNLQLLAGLDEAYEAFREELEVSVPETLQEEMQRLQAQVATREHRLDDLKNERGGLETQIRELEQAEEASELRLRINSLDTELAVHAEQWSILQIAQALLVETRDHYEREHKPGVIQEAQPIFANLTGDRYKRILSPPGERKIDVLDEGGRRKEIDHLSGGTKEQLLLAVRLGFIREYSSRVQPLPIVMDDILVNFDPLRRRAAASVLAQLAETHQILYFTCHPEIVATLTEAAPQSVTIPLST